MILSFYFMLSNHLQNFLSNVSTVAYGSSQMKLSNQSSHVLHKLVPKIYFQLTRSSIPFFVATMWNALMWAFGSDLLLSIGY
jgi:hypothetical protein